ncbi:MFS transporter, DHA1 family, inner membrane transport protein [Saccharopolyspora antimicrobica]|uniref:DHA1 family inner membrane transport protein n=1 Tax=Saccharopolyspora antimicrobica TaxID=455193 RepID=A0A1I5F4W7_9PSEU|nr:MFS transporter [Saccharopolyspora antimicrobica]RKT83682.1 DHA1 family inner membrane transport protein [Saccharopolyspora antimicrobica]SFO18767.1 MFS transporter, DHA1 family, inner membrane transport protein [Saccharopolyspora antimicrobica]
MTSAVETAPHRWAVPVLGFGTFAVGTCEFVLAGLLPQLSSTLRVSIGTAGQVVTAFALTCALLAPVLATATASWQRRRVLLLATGVYLVGNIATALAPSFPLVIAAQIVAAAGAGLFVPTAAVTASALVPADRRGRAIAVVTTGFTAATAMGAPLGTALGAFFGWRVTMWFVAGLAVLGLLGLVRLVPADVATPAAEGLRERLAPLSDRRVLVVLATTLIAFTAVYLPYTYIGAVFGPATGGSGVRLAVLMFLLGVIGTVGNYVAGMLADRFGSSRVVAFALVWLVVALLVLPLTTGGFGWATAEIAFYGIAAFAITTPQQHRLITLSPGSAPVLVSLNAAILYLAIALSGIIGAAGIAWAGPQLLGPIAAAFAAIALVLSTRSR